MPKPIDFENTEIAFARLSNQDVKRAYFLFSLLAIGPLTKVGLGVSKLAVKLHMPIAWFVKATVYRIFCGGETAEESLPKVDQSFTYRVRSILDYSTEAKSTEEDFQKSFDELIKCMEIAKTSDAIQISVFKPTALVPLEILEKISKHQELSASEESQRKLFVERVDALCQKAIECDIRLYIDAEESWIQDYLDEVATDMMIKYNKDSVNVYNTIQLYRHDRLEYLKKAHKYAIECGFKLGLKLVRGAYMEKERDRAAEKGYPSPINPTKEATDKAYNQAIDYCLKHLDTIAICVGTHNVDSVKHTLKSMETYGYSVDDPRIEFSQLFGMSDNLTYNLAQNKYNASKYLPFGPVKEVLPYLFRRVEENSSIQGQTTRELSLLRKEMQRRHQRTKRHF